MSRKSRKIIIIICIIIFLLPLLQYLPFIPYIEFLAGISFLFVLACAILSIFALPIVAITGLIALIIKEKNTIKITVRLSVIMLSFILSLLNTLGPMDNLAEKYELLLGDKLISQIEQHKQLHDQYPKEYTSSPPIPHLMFYEHRYKRTSKGYTLVINHNSIGTIYYVHDPYKEYNKGQWTNFSRTINEHWDLYISEF